MSKSKKLLLLLPVLAIALASYTYINRPVVVSQKEEAIDQALMQSLSQFHYSPLVMNDDFSEKVFKLYLERLDYSKKFLIASDVAELKQYERSIDDDIKNREFNFFDKSVEIIDKRVAEAKAYYIEALAKPFDFTKDDSLQLDPEKLAFCNNKEELKDAWYKSMKYQTLVQIVDMSEKQEKAKQRNDTAKVKDETFKFKTKTELDSAARAKVLKSNDDYFKRLKTLNRNDRLASYFNAVTAMYDPHTEYFAPKDKANFDIGMSGQLEGIGAQLQEKDGLIKVANIIVGSASYKQGQLKVGDVIMKVAQGPADPVDVTDMRLDEAVQLIRGKKGTEVRLTVKKPDASVIVIPIIRDIVVIEDTYAQSVILKGKKKLGYIKLPEFYADFTGRGGRSCSADVKIELQKLKDQNVNGVILDLRYNGGGSLPDVVKMAGLFIDKGPIVQVKQKNALANVLQDEEAGVFYDGPLTILVNSNSASASEILAAAMQDYRRGIIVGTSPATFGKGTVQRFYDLDDYLPPKKYDDIKPLGSVKITMQKFYRVNGGATQLKGVIPDIVLPDPYYLLDQGEKEQDYPMTWDEIPPATYSVLKPSYSVNKLRASSENRVKNNPGFEVLTEAAKRFKQQKDNTMVSLNYDKYLADQKVYKAEVKKLESLDKEIPGVEVLPLAVDVAAMGSDTVKTNKAKEWYKSLKKDIYLNETIAIMNDIK
jgi:carboxyl-terminal processing protease